MVLMEEALHLILIAQVVVDVELMIVVNKELLEVQEEEQEIMLNLDMDLIQLVQQEI